MDSERRKAIRVKKTLIAQYFDKEKNGWNMANVKDLSEGGMCFMTDNPMPIGEVVPLRFKLPSQPLQILEINAQVIESKKYSTRLAFLELTDNTLELLREYVAIFLKKEGRM